MRGALQRDDPDLVCCGLQRGEALARHYASADLFVFPSRSETFGNVFLEALASVLPTVAFSRLRRGASVHNRPGSAGYSP